TKHDVLTVVEGGVNKWRSLVRGNRWEALAQDEGGRVSAVAAAERDCGIKAILGNPSVPTRVDRVRKENPVAGTHNGVGRQAVRQSQPGRKRFLIQLLRIAIPETGRSPFGSSKGQPARAIAGSRVGSQQIEEGKIIKFFQRG